MRLPDLPEVEPPPSPWPEGSVHGRFQLLHNDHLEYILSAKKLCDFLWVGITQYAVTPEHMNPLGRHRERPEANPLTYFERVQIIREALGDCGVSREVYDFVPFPIETPSALPAFLPRHVVCFTTICEEWNREKIRVLESNGYSVHVLWERVPKGIQGTDVRESIARGDSAWKEMVPSASVRAVERLDLRNRLRSLLSGGNEER